MKKNMIVIILMSLLANMAYADGGRGGDGRHSWQRNDSWRGGYRVEGTHGSYRGEGRRGGRGDGELGLIFGLGLVGGMLLQPATVYSQPVYLQSAPVYVQAPYSYIQTAPVYLPPAESQIIYGPTTYYNGYEPH